MSTLVRWLGQQTGSVARQLQQKNLNQQPPWRYGQKRKRPEKKKT